ncbi:4-(cytidine 5'-diphospho)-2-C-methyl-D-erythritol kinase [Euhalothece natronophila Z-M001]|uniref:4-diphosphocytidyl-2-C-methyl-D-erythritol kinase n=1 Tax=Euhalothece natronophila Z-M001 TaxID=522448 RepID=A0A5B8NJC2_9CHRO|nr:4-(cytidine 5'-diphospho)-2-C-methyl-D-erythritol kinase [Euhalothece natronophila]QDZ38601.1 4-(cytidine 5'-diphospho)-2-C-methyl-D-erythritol kinase [Euhalothece natronophila Z-M001]
MRHYSLTAPAKINLHLEILGDRADGYHELVMILQGINLADRIDIKAGSTQDIHLHCEHPDVPLGKENIAYKAAQLMCREYSQSYAQYGGLDITIEKNIPVAAGLAGGSTDAAAVLVGINLLWKLGLTQPELQILANQLGSDIPFCLEGGTALALGRGEELSPLEGLDDVTVILAKHRNLYVSTAWAYQTYRQQYEKTYVEQPETLELGRKQAHSGNLVSAIGQRDYTKIGKLLYNDLEKVVFPSYPDVEALKLAFQEQEGVLGTLMSGSGPTVFTLCSSPTAAKQVVEGVKAKMNDPALEFWITELTSTGIEVT